MRKVRVMLDRLRWVLPQVLVLPGDEFYSPMLYATGTVLEVKPRAVKVHWQSIAGDGWTKDEWIKRHYYAGSWR